MKRSSKKGLYSDEISAAIREHSKLPLRSEKQLEFHDLFVDNRQLDLIKKPDWQVIYGRRGTGKTFLLSMLNEESLRQLSDSRAFSIYITAQDCTASPVGKVVSDKRRALGYFQAFIELMTEGLVVHVDRLIERKGILNWLVDAYERRVDKIQTIALEILSLSQDGRSISAFQESGSLKTIDEDESSTSVNHGLGLKAGLTKAAIDLGLGSKRGVTKKIKSTQEREETIFMVPSYPAIRQRIVELLKLMEIEQLNILIDEWSTLDPTASTAIQPEFAELLKRTFAGVPQISVKIATNRYQTRFSNRGKGGDYRGLEIDADIFLATNLDHVLSTEEERVDFFSQLLFKRLLFCNSNLNVFLNHAKNGPDEQFIFSIFRNKQAFMELVNSADGIPREFLIMFNELSKKANFSVSETWKQPFIRDTIFEKSVEGQSGDIDYKSEADQLLYRCIRDVVKQTDGRLFLVSHKQLDTLEGAIEELLEKRIIHDYPRRKLTDTVRNEYDAFIVNYGIYLGWRNPSNILDSFVDIPPITPDKLNGFVIDPTLIDLESLSCSSCNASFHKEARPYVLKKLCPICFESADPKPSDG